MSSSTSGAGGVDHNQPIYHGGGASPPKQVPQQQSGTPAKPLGDSQQKKTSDALSGVGEHHSKVNAAQKDIHAAAAASKQGVTKEELQGDVAKLRGYAVTLLSNIAPKARIRADQTDLVGKMLIAKDMVKNKITDELRQKAENDPSLRDLIDDAEQLDFIISDAFSEKVEPKIREEARRPVRAEMNKLINTIDALALKHQDLAFNLPLHIGSEHYEKMPDDGEYVLKAEKFLKENRKKLDPSDPTLQKFDKAVDGFWKLYGEDRSHLGSAVKNDLTKNVLALRAHAGRIVNLKANNVPITPEIKTEVQAMMKDVADVKAKLTESLRKNGNSDPDLKAIMDELDELDIVISDEYTENVEPKIKEFDQKPFITKGMKTHIARVDQAIENQEKLLTSESRTRPQQVVKMTETVTEAEAYLNNNVDKLGANNPLVIMLRSSIERFFGK